MSPLCLLGNKASAMVASALSRSSSVASGDLTIITMLRMATCTSLLHSINDWNTSANSLLSNCAESGAVAGVFLIVSANMLPSFWLSHTVPVVVKPKLLSLVVTILVKTLDHERTPGFEDCQLIACEIVPLLRKHI